MRIRRCAILYLEPREDAGFDLASLLAGNALGLAWGAVLGDSLGYNSALMLPVLSAGAYLLLAHLYGYLWRQRFERRETDARLARHLARRDGR